MHRCDLRSGGGGGVSNQRSASLFQSSPVLYKEPLQLPSNIHTKSSTVVFKMHILTLLALPPILLLTRYFLSLLYLTYTTRTLQSIPGPFWARFTRLWYFRRLWNGHFEDDNIRLHNQYGPIVRIAPDHYSISDRAALKTIYGAGTKFAKSAWYEGWKHPDPERWTLFPDRNIKRHGRLLYSFFLFC